MTVSEEIPATYTDTGERCTVTVTSSRPWRSFAVGERLVSRVGPDHCEDRGRLIRADVPGAFGGF